LVVLGHLSDLVPPEDFVVEADDVGPASVVQRRRGHRHGDMVEAGLSGHRLSFQWGATRTLAASSPAARRRMLSSRCARGTASRSIKSSTGTAPPARRARASSNPPLS